MNRSWNVLRTHLALADSSRRSGRAYELLLEWAGFPADLTLSNQDHADENRDLRPGLDPTPGPDSEAIR
jgi:hypothetical protein